MRSAAAVPASPLRRAVTATGSLLLLAGLVGGLPVALVLFAGNPLPGELPGPAGIWSALTSPDDGSLFLSVLAVVGWLAWASFTVSVVLEVVSRLTRRRAPSIPGLRGQQRFAAVLVAAVAAIAASPTFTSAAAALVDSPPIAVTGPVNPAEHPASRGFGAAAPEPVQRGFGTADEAVVHLVARGEGLLDLQDRYGVPWQRIADLNYGVEQPDGRTLERGQTRIYPGWQMTIPATGPTAGSNAPAPGPQVGFGARDDSAGQAGSDVAAQPAEYEVAEGDWMWHIADRYLGDPERYRDIEALNPQYADQHGHYPDHIEPGWVLKLPEDAVDSGPQRHATGTATTVEPEAPQQDDREEPEQPERPEQQDEAAPTPPPAPEPEPEAPEPEAPEPSPPAQATPDPGYGGAVPPPVPVPPAPPPVPVPPPAPAPAPPPPVAAPAPQGPVVSGFGSAPDAPAEAANPHHPDGFSTDGEQVLERLAPAALAGAGLLTALVLGAAAHHARRRRQHHRTGHRFASPAAMRLEKTLRAAQQPLDTARLDTALRALAAGLAGWTRPLPDIAGAMLDRGSVHLLLAAPCSGPPPPWQDHGDRWTLPAGLTAPPPAGSAPLAPLPMLAAIGSQAGIHLLLDLERLGFLAIHGDPQRALDLLRYLAAELACNTWSDAAEVLVAGFDPRETELLVTLSPERVRVFPSIADAVMLLRRRAASAHTTLGHTGAADALAGRVHGVVSDAWVPQVLLAAAPTPADMAALAELEQMLDGTRCAVAVATADPAPPKHDAWRVTVTPDGVVHVRLPFLRASLSAAGLAVAELVPLAETVRAARTAPPAPVPVAAEAEPWAAGVDAAGAPHTAGAAHTTGAATPPPAQPSPAGVNGNGEVPASAEPLTVPTQPIIVPALQPGSAPDLTLDTDLAAWREADPGRPRIGVLGPVIVEAAGPPPESRRRLHTELVVYLAQRGARGADAPLIDSALWPDTTLSEPARQRLLSRIRRWLGTQTSGAPWLPDVGPDLGYRLAGGYLFDWHLFRRLRSRGERRGPDGGEDLRAALQLVRGVPLDGADRPAGPGTRNPYPWLAESDIHPDHVVATIVDSAHLLAEQCLAAGDPSGARWAVQQAWLADPQRSFEQPWQDLLRAEHADGQTGALRAVLADLMEARDAEAPEDLAPETYQLVSAWPRNVLLPAGP